MTHENVMEKIELIVINKWKKWGKMIFCIFVDHRCI